MKFFLNFAKTTILPTLLVMNSAAVLAAAPYQVDTLSDNLGGATPSHINDKGEAVGEISAGEDVSHAVFWNSDGLITDITPSSYSYRITPAGITNGSDVIYSENDRIYLWNAGSVTDLGQGYAIAINENKQIVGYFNNTIGIWSNGTVTTLPVPASASYAYPTDINIHADVVGYAYYANTGTYRAVLWQNGVALDLGTLQDDVKSFALGINDQRQIVGYSLNNSSKSRAFLWDNGVIQDLALPGVNAYAFSINNASQIIGSFNNGTYPVHPFIMQNGSYSDLISLFGTPAFSLPCLLNSINDKGQMVVKCDKAYRITPVANAADLSVTMSETPFPATATLPLALTATITNIGNLSANDIMFTQSLPSTGYTIVSISSSQGSCSGSAQITCALGTLASDTSANVTITVIPTVAGYFKSNATVNALEVEVNLINNQVSSSVPVYENNADLRVSSINSQTSATRGSNITYKWVVRNSGQNVANNVKLSDTIPNGLALVSVNTTAGTCSGSTTVTCNLGDIRYAFEETVTIVVKATNRGTYTNTAVVSSSTPDSYTANNSVSVTTKVK